MHTEYPIPASVVEDQEAEHDYERDTHRQESCTEHFRVLFAEKEREEYVGGKQEPAPEEYLLGPLLPGETEAGDVTDYHCDSENAAGNDVVLADDEGLQRGQCADSGQ